MEILSRQVIFFFKISAPSLISHPSGLELFCHPRKMSVKL
jgi:hypothetical protein